MKFATCNEYFENWAIEDVFNYAADLGYDGVEIAPFALAPSVEDISAPRRDEIRAAAEKAGVEIVGLHWLLASPEGLYVSHPNPEIYQRTCAYFKALIQFCGDLGGQVMIIGSPMQRNIQEGWENYIFVTQVGSDNDALVIQDGDRNTASVEQNGSNNSARIEQIGDDLTNSVVQNASNQFISVATFKTW